MIFVFMMVALFAAGNAQASNADQVPDSIKNKIKSWASGHGTDSQFAEALSELSKRGIIQAKIAQGQNTYMLPGYGDIVFVKISGRTEDVGQTSPVSLTVTDPEGKKSDYTTPVLRSGVYSTVIPLRHDSPVGTYLVVAQHAGKKLPDSSFHVGHQAKTPRWISTMASWWLDGKTTDREFLAAVEFLLDNRIIEFSGGHAGRDGMDVTVEGHKAVRRGTPQDVTVHVTNIQGPIDGATVFVRVEDHSKTVFEEFEGRTDSNGRYTVSWRISHDFANLKTFLVYVDVTDGFSSSTKMFSFQTYCLCGEPNCMCRP